MKLKFLKESLRITIALGLKYFLLIQKIRININKKYAFQPKFI